MRQELHSWRSEAGSGLWLSMLVAAMQDASRPEMHRTGLEASELEQLRAQLALPASAHLYQASASSLRH
jgi:hypothetical protein